MKTFLTALFILVFSLVFITAQDTIRPIIGKCQISTFSNSTNTNENIIAVFFNDSLQLSGTIAANCCGEHFLVVGKNDGLLDFTTLDTGLLCNCICEYPFNVKVKAQLNDTAVRINGKIYKVNNRQAFQLFDPKRIAFYSFVNDEITSLKFDSVSANGKILYPFKNIQFVDNNCYKSLGASWIGEKILKNSNFQILFNKNNDSIFIKTSAQMNEKWQMFHSKDSMIVQAQVVKYDTMNVLGIIDTVKVIRMQAYKNGNVEPSIVNGLEIILSKNYGLIKSYNFLYFPNLTGGYYDDLKEYILCGLSNPAIGVQNLTWKDVYAISPGDELHIEERYHQLALITLSKMKLKYIARQEQNDSIIFKIDREWKLEKFKAYDGDKLFQYSHDTTTEIVKANPNFDKLPGEPVFEGNFMFTEKMYKGIRVSKLERPTNNMYLKNDSCWSFIMADGCFPDYMYYKGLGGPYYECWDFEGFGRDFRELVYYKNSSGSWGQPLVIDAIENLTDNLQIKVSQNPETDVLNIKNSLKSLSIRILDIQGRLLLQTKISLGETSVAIENQPKGIFLYQILDNGKIIQTGKFVRK